MTVALESIPTTAEWLDRLAADERSLDDRFLAEALVRRGAGLAAEMRRRPLRRIRKTSVSDIVTAADHEAEATIVAAIERLRPEDGIVGEEGAARVSRSGRTWIIDPVDGTYNFAHGVGPWCSAIALRGPGEQLIGAIRQELTDETWVGVAGGPGATGTWLNGIRLEPVPDLPLPEISLATYLHPTRWEVPELREPWDAICHRMATVRVLGSGSCDLAAVAAGRLGAFLQSSTTDWDWYPGAALILGAGRAVAVFEHRGVRWHVAGGRRAVDEIQTLVTTT